MQRHKSWLVITIWISTIAFVGAGFVGWGSYNYGKAGGDIAKVGDVTISYQDVRDQYSRLYSQYSETFGEQFNQELADKLKLETIAYNGTVSSALIVNYAQDLGLVVTDKEVSKELVRYDAFMKDGKFDKDIYIKVLSQNKNNPKEFERKLKQDILLRKVQDIFNKFVKNSDKEIETISTIFAIQDDIDINIISTDDIVVDKNDTKLKEYWQENKQLYVSNTKYKANISEVAIVDGDEKKAKTKALKLFIDLKKSKQKFEKTAQLDISDTAMAEDDINKIQNATKDKLLKPIQNGDKFMIIQVIETIPPKPLPFAEVIDEVALAYKVQVLLKQKAQESLKNFSGTSIGTISMDKFEPIDGLSESQSQAFYSQIFSRQDNKGIITIEDKNIVYHIKKSEFAQPVIDETRDIISQKLDTIKVNLLMSKLLENLKTKYEVKRY
jgi:peptidyl-prolyl cis-trans isomerase D